MKWFTLCALVLALLSSNVEAQSLIPTQTDKQINCLALTVYHESRSLDLDQQISVAWVVINRTKNKKFPSTICKVVWQPNQFTWTNVIKDYRPKDEKAWNKANKIALLVYKNRLFDPTKGSNFFYEKNMKKPKWAYKMKIKYEGKHFIFLAMK